jgi:hypothetical protein
VDAAAIGWDVTVFNNRSQDEILTQILNAQFGKRAEIEIRSEPHADGTVTKVFWIGQERAAELLLDSRDFVAEYEARGLRVEYFEPLTKALEKQLSGKTKKRKRPPRG